MHPGILAATVAFLCAYAVGALPVAWLLVRRRTGLDMRRHGLGGTGSLDAFTLGGPQTAALAAVLEVAKGAVVGAAARWYAPQGWFVAAAIAGCVLGDAFPVGFRRGGRGVVPLVAGLVVALPTAGLITAIVAVPAAMLRSFRGRVYEGVVAVAVPAGLFAGTRDWRSLVPAAVIVAVLVVRARLRRRRSAALRSGRPPLVLDAYGNVDSSLSGR